MDSWITWKDVLYIDSLMQERHNFNDNTLELRLSCTIHQYWDNALDHLKLNIDINSVRNLSQRPWAYQGQILIDSIQQQAPSKGGISYRCIFLSGDRD